MALPNVNITPIPDSDPDAVPALWNTRYNEIDQNFLYLQDALEEQEGNAEGADEAVKLAWLIQEAHIEIEQWVEAWRLHDNIDLAVTQGVAGDDSVDVASTSDLIVGREYVITDGINFESIVVGEILSATRFTATANLVHSYTIGASIVGCQWSISPRLATAANGQICYFGVLNVGDDEVDKQVIIRLEAGNDCTIRVYFTDATHLTWTECVSEEAIALRNRTDFVDIPYILPAAGDLKLKFVCEEGETNSEIDIELIAVMRPFNVNIEIHNEDPEAHEDIRQQITDDIAAHNTDVESHSGGLDVVDDAILAHDTDPTAHGLDVLFPSGSELMPNQVDRDFSGASAWENVDVDSYDETGDLSLVASGIGQYCKLPVASAPMTPGEAYTLSFTVANLVSTFTIKSYNGVQTYGTVDGNGTVALPVSATTDGGIRIVADAVDSAADFDNFSLKEAANWEPVIEFKVGQHNDDVSAHSAIQTKIGTDIGAHNTDSGNNAHPSIRNKIDDDIAAVQDEIDDDISVHDTDAPNNAHPTLRSKITSDISSHNLNVAAHADIRDEIDSDISAHDTDSGNTAHANIRSKIATDIASHNASSSSHANIRAKIDSDISAHDTDSGNTAHANIRSKIATDIGAHNTSTVAHSYIQGLISGIGNQGGWLTPRLITENMTAQSGDMILANTSGAPIVVTLPVAPETGDAILFVDIEANFNINYLTCAYNGKKIMGEYEDLVCDVQNAAFMLIYNAVSGWRLA
jgi:hypothetical protein